MRKYENVKIDKLIPYENNARTHSDEQVEKIMRSIKVNLEKLTKDELLDMVKDLLEEQVPTTIIHEDKPMRNDVHPTMKPIKLIGRLVKNSSKPKENVIDFFGGSGSTLIACEQLGRNCYSMELDPKYIDVIIDRWEKLTGEKAVLLNGDN